MASMPLRVGVFGFALALAAWLFSASAQPNFPELTGRIVDNAQLLSEADETALAAELKALEEKSSDQVVVVTIPSLQGYTIEDYGYQLGRQWGIGTAKLNNGVLLIVAPNERKVRIEVGRGLEPTLTDALSKIVIEHGILPRFRAGDFAGGIKDGVGDIVRVLTGDAAEVEARARARQDADHPAIDWLFVILWVAILLWVMYGIWRSIRATPHATRRRDGTIVLPGPTWSGGGGGSGGGGFSGGGGSFGGGGASGSW